MSNREKCAVLLDSVPEYKLGYVLAYLQGLTADEVDETPNATTVAALIEGDEMLRNGTGEAWTGSTEDLWKRILEEDE